MHSPSLCTPMPTTLQALQERITAAVKDIDGNMLLNVWTELDYLWDVCRVTKGAHIEHLWYVPETCYRGIEDLPYNDFCGVLACDSNSFPRPQWEERSPKLKHLLILRAKIISIAVRNDAFPQT
ncbi:hypothetical protein AVEN_119070-1 [Araneus ventricosus]|uniref:Uncharacterized protein n=1 Tax=Araneus ventricosus TaxID=182803 RepID=A0A4Y2BM38_ARAVE|nr:hypothetical protein AVEN_119070-1 [Araneus ventricosus]